MANEKELKERMEEISRKIGVMEWDKSRNQFNPGKEGLYTSLKEEMEKISQEMSQFSKPANDTNEEAAENKLIRED